MASLHRDMRSNPVCTRGSSQQAMCCTFCVSRSRQAVDVFGFTSNRRTEDARYCKKQWKQKDVSFEGWERCGQKPRVCLLEPNCVVKCESFPWGLRLSKRFLKIASETRKIREGAPAFSTIGPIFEIIPSLQSVLQVSVLSPVFCVFVCQRPRRCWSYVYRKVTLKKPQCACGLFCQVSFINLEGVR